MDPATGIYASYSLFNCLLSSNCQPIHIQDMGFVDITFEISRTPRRAVPPCPAYRGEFPRTR